MASLGAAVSKTAPSEVAACPVAALSAAAFPTEAAPAVTTVPRTAPPTVAFPAAAVLTAAAPTAGSFAAAVPAPSAAAVPQAFPAVATSSKARVRLGVDLSEGPLAPHPVRCCPVPVRPTSTTRGRRTGAPSDTRAWPHTQTHTREGRVSSSPERTRGRAASTTRAHDRVREPPSYQGLPFSFTHLAGQLEHWVLKHDHQEFVIAILICL